MEHRRRLPHVLGCGDGVDCHTAALARSSCVWAPSTNATHRGVLAGAASIRHRRPPRPDRQPSSDGVDRGVLAGACASTPGPAGAARVRGRSHSSAGLRPNRGRPWPQRRRPRLLHTVCGRGMRRCGPRLASLNTPATAASHVPRTSSSLRPSLGCLLSPHDTVSKHPANVQGGCGGGRPERAAGVLRPSGCRKAARGGAGRKLSPANAHRRESLRGHKPL